MNSWLRQIAETAVRDHTTLGSDLRSARDFQSTFEQLADDVKAHESHVKTLNETAQKMAASGDPAAPQVTQAAQELSNKWNNILGIIEVRTKISRTYVTFHKTVHSVSTTLLLQSYTATILQ